MSHVSTSHAFHSAHSNTYDRMASYSSFNIIKQIIPSLPVPISDESYVLDNACGTGIASMVIKSHHPAARIHGADVASGMVEMYKQRATTSSWPNVTAEVLDCRDLSTIGAGTFSHVVTNFGFSPTPNDLEGPLRAAKEMYRVLKPGGIAVVTTWAERNFDRALDRALRRVRPQETPYSWSASTPASWSRGSFLFAHLEDAGFSDKHKIEVKSLVGRMEAENVEALVGNMMLFKGMFFANYSDEEVRRLEEVLREEVVKCEGFEQGEWGAGIKMVAWVGIAEK